ILHQAFEQYGAHLDHVTRNEWAKVQGRFEDIAFQEPPEQMLRLLAAALTPPEQTLDLRRTAAAEAVDPALLSGVCPPGLSPEEFRDLAARCYPLHPVAMVALPYLFRRYGQNERSLFSYLTSGEPYGFQQFLKSHRFDPRAPIFVRLADLFDYFTANFG